MPGVILPDRWEALPSLLSFLHSGRARGLVGPIIGFDLSSRLRTPAI